MKRLERIRVLGVVYVIIYGVTLYFATLDGALGNLFLAILDIVGIGVAAFIFARAVNIHQWTTQQEAARILGWIAIGLLVSAIIHAIGMFLQNQEDQLLCAFAPVVLWALVIVGRWANTNKWPEV